MKTRQIHESLIVLPLLMVTACTHAPPNLPSANEITQYSTNSTTKEDSSENRVPTLRAQAFQEYLRGEFPKAISHLETALTLDVQSQENWARFILYYCYLAVGDYDRALSTAEALAKEHPYQSLPYQQVGMAQLWLGQSAAAIQNFQRALDFEAHAPRVHFYLGLAYSKLGQDPAKEKAFQEALTEYDRILNTNPKDFTANYELAALLLYWNKNLERVTTLLATSREGFTPSTPEVDVPQEKKLYLNFYIPLLEGILLVQKGEAKAAKTVLLDLIPNLPSGIRADLAEIYFYLGKSYQLLNENRLAKAFLEKSTGLDPKGAYSLETAKIIRTIASKESIVP